jgi:hypothetical protein
MIAKAAITRNAALRGATRRRRIGSSIPAGHVDPRPHPVTVMPPHVYRGSGGALPGSNAEPRERAALAVSQAGGPPTQADDLPDRADGSPDQADGPPTEADGPPDQADGSPTEADGPPDQARDPPIEADGPPDQADGPPTEADGPPDRADDLPDQADGPPTEADGPPAQAEQPPVAEDDGPPRQQARPRAAGSAQDGRHASSTRAVLPPLPLGEEGRGGEGPQSQNTIVHPCAAACSLV